MPGNPKRHADLARLTADTALQETVWTRVEEGVGYSRICMELGIGKAALLDWLESEANAERATRARARAASALADETVEIADSAGDARLRIGTRQWLAERFDRARFGQTQKVEVSGQVTHLHLAALQATAKRRQAEQLQASEPEVLDVEVKTLEQQLNEL